MPSPKAGTVSADPASSVAEFKVCGARSAPRPGQPATRDCHMDTHRGDWAAAQASHGVGSDADSRTQLPLAR